MLAIRMQRTGRSGHAQFRVIVQDSRFSPKRGRIVSYLGNYDPHTKEATIDSEMASRYLQNGAQPSDTVARLFKKEGIKLPAWVKLDEPKKRTVRNPEKRRSTAPEKPIEPKPTPPETTEAGPAEEAQTEAVPEDEVKEPTEEPVTEAQGPEESAEPKASEDTAQEKPPVEESTEEKPSES